MQGVGWALEAEERESTYGEEKRDKREGGGVRKGKRKQEERERKQEEKGRGRACVSTCL